MDQVSHMLPFTVSIFFYALYNSSFYVGNIAVLYPGSMYICTYVCMYVCVCVCVCTVRLLSFRTACAERILRAPSGGHPQKHVGASLDTLCA